MTHRISVRAAAAAITVAAAAVAVPSGSPAAESPYAPASLVFVRDADPPGKASTLQVLDLASGAVRKLLAPGTQAYAPSVSPDGTQVVYDLSNKAKSGLHIVAIDGTGDRTLKAGGRHRLLGHPTWSPDGSRVFYDVARLDKKGNYVANSSEIYSIAADGTGETRLTDNKRDDYTPAVTPDGKTVVFSRQLPGKKLNADLWTMAVDGSGQKRLTHDKAEEYSPTVSPDGQHIALERCICNLVDPNKTVRKYYSIQVVDIDGGNRVTLAPSKGNDAGPSWSSDGSTIAFYSDRADKKADKKSGYFRDQLYTVKADGTGAARLLKSKFGDSEPSFVP